MSKRALSDVIKRRLEEKKPLIQVVVGPRQIGKTTALKDALSKQGVYESADSPITLSHDVIYEWWERAEKKDHILAIDEVQKIPGWSEAVKKCWDGSKVRVKVIVTGSSAILIEKGLKETLAGRHEIIRAEHWNYSEAKKIFNLPLDKFIEYGCYPGSMQFIDDVNRWSSYIKDSIVEPVIGRDILQLHPVDNPSLLRQLFGLAVSLPAQIISLQKLCANLSHKGSIPTVKNYLRLLGEAFIVSSVDKYSESSFRSRTSIPKLIVHDNALIRAFEKPINLKLDNKRLGRYFENIIGARFIEAGWDVYYWKDRNLEVDFIVIGPENQKQAIEVKLSRPSKDELRGLTEFCKLNEDFEPYIICLEDCKVEGIKSLNVEDVLSLTRKL